MPSIDPKLITHKVNTDPVIRPVRQKKRNLALERWKAVDEEVEKLLAADFIREVHYPSWVANPVLVKKANGKWRMCVDYTDLNRACPKDCFPLPRIDRLVDATSGHELLSFLDAYSGYNQIRMDQSDEEKTSFITEFGLYCYKVMPFRLKNAGATFQRLVNRLFRPLIGTKIECYVDDMVVKTQFSQELIQDLDSVFQILRQYNMRLNPNKCVFGVTSGKFLGYVVNRRGIEANPDKIQAILDMRPPRKIKEVQRLNGRIAALSRFMSKSADRCLPFFKAIKGKGFEWTQDCQLAFDELKKYLASVPILTPVEEGEVLELYLSASDEVVSSVLIKEVERVQQPIYYVSKILQGAETRYP